MGRNNHLQLRQLKLTALSAKHQLGPLALSRFNYKAKRYRHTMCESAAWHVAQPKWPCVYFYFSSCESLDEDIRYTVSSKNSVHILLRQ
jgi:hypothetical protein